MTATEVQVSLTADDLALLIELVEREQGELPTEIHHTRTRVMRDKLHHRQQKLEDLMVRLRSISS